MDQDYELQKAKWLLIGVALFLIGGCFSWGELMYLLAGKDARAAVTEVLEIRGKRGGTRWKITFTFNEPNGTARADHDFCSPNWPISPDGTVAVRYTAGGDGRARLSGNVSWLGLGLFGGSLLLIGWGVFALLREARESERPRRRRR